jgi:hypothetical protein
MKEAILIIHECAKFYLLLLAFVVLQNYMTLQKHVFNCKQKCAIKAFDTKQNEYSYFALENAYIKAKLHALFSALCLIFCSY